MVRHDDATALPHGKRTAPPITLGRVAELKAVDDNVQPLAADFLTRKCQNAFDERHAARQISSIGEEGRDGFWWPCDH